MENILFSEFFLGCKLCYFLFDPVFVKAISVSECWPCLHTVCPQHTHLWKTASVLIPYTVQSMTNKLLVQISALLYLVICFIFDRVVTTERSVTDLLHLFSQSFTVEIYRAEVLFLKTQFLIMYISQWISIVKKTSQKRASILLDLSILSNTTSKNSTLSFSFRLWHMESLTIWLLGFLKTLLTQAPPTQVSHFYLIRPPLSVTVSSSLLLTLFNMLRQFAQLLLVCW